MVPQSDDAIHHEGDHQYAKNQKQNGIVDSTLMIDETDDTGNDVFVDSIGHELTVEECETDL